MQLVAPFIGRQHVGNAIQRVARTGDAVAEAAHQDIETVAVGGVGGQIRQVQHQGSTPRALVNCSVCRMPP